MADPIDYKARIKAKGTDGTGITREHAKRMANTQGSHTMLIVDVEHARLIIEEDGSKQIQLSITSAEVVPAEQEETVRRFQRAIYLQRPDVAGQAVLSGTADGESPEDAAGGLLAAVETDEAGEVTGMWNGDPDAPLTDSGTQIETTTSVTSVTRGLSAVPDQADGSTPVETACPFPECGRQEDHDGPHRDRAGHVLGSDVDDEGEE